jgi:hypothetical protein
VIVFAGDGLGAALVLELPGVLVAEELAGQVGVASVLGGQHRSLPVRLSLVLFTAIRGLVAVHVIHDGSMGTELEHLLSEGILMLCGVAGAVMFWRFWLAVLAGGATAGQGRTPGCGR